MVDQLDIDLVPGRPRAPGARRAGLIAANRRTIAARLDGIRAALADGPKSAYDLVDAVMAAAGMPTRDPRLRARQLAFPETLCYLDHLERLGEVAREDAGDQELWRLAT